MLTQRLPVHRVPTYRSLERARSRRPRCLAPRPRARAIEKRSAVTLQIRGLTPPITLLAISYYIPARSPTAQAHRRSVVHITPRRLAVHAPGCFLPTLSPALCEVWFVLNGSLRSRAKTPSFISSRSADVPDGGAPPSFSAMHNSTHCSFVLHSSACAFRFRFRFR